MKDQVLFVLMIMALCWGFYKYVKTRNEGLLYSLLYCGSVFSQRYPFYVPFGFSLSFISFLGCGVFLYKVLYQKLDKSLYVYVILFLVSGIIFLLQGLLSPDRTQLWVTAEFGFGICLFLGFGVLLYKIWYRKLDRSLIIFNLSLFVFGFVFFAQALFLPAHTQGLLSGNRKHSKQTMEIGKSDGLNKHAKDRKVSPPPVERK